MSNYNYDISPLPPSAQNINEDYTFFDTANYFNNASHVDFNYEDLLYGTLMFPNLTAQGSLSDALPAPLGESTGSAQASFLNIQFDLTNLITESIFGVPLEFDLPINIGYLDADIYASFIQFLVGLQFSIAQQFSFTPAPQVTLNFAAPTTWTDPAGVSHTNTQAVFNAGESISITMPSGTDPEVQVTPAYTLLNQFSNQTDLQIAPGWEFDPLDVAISAAIDGYNLIDFSYDAPSVQMWGQPLLTLNLYQNTFTVDGFNSPNGKQISLFSNVHKAPNIAALDPDTVGLYLVAPQTTLSAFKSFVGGSTPVVVSGSQITTTSQAQLAFYGTNVPLKSTYASSSQLTVQIPNWVLLFPGTATIHLVDGGKTGNETEFTVAFPTPTLTAASPALWAADPNSKDTALSIIGSNFIPTPDYFWSPGSTPTPTRLLQQYWNKIYLHGPRLPALLPDFPYFDTDMNGSPIVSPGMAPVPTVTWNAQSLMLYSTDNTGAIMPALLPPNLYASSALYNVTAVNPEPGGGASNNVNVRIAAPTPQLTALSQNTVNPGSAGFVLKVTGTSQIPTGSGGTAYGFEADSLVNWTVNGNTQALATTFVSPTEVDAAIPASLLATTASVTVSVVNPDVEANGVNDTITSNSLSLSVGYPVPQISGLNPSSAVPGDARFNQSSSLPTYNMLVTGSGFVNGCTVLWNGSSRSTQFVSPTSVAVQILSSDVAQAGTNQITVSNPGGQVSNQQPFVVGALTPTITLLAPNAAPVGSGDTNITIIGTNFYSGSTVSCGGSAVNSQYLGTTQMLATIPAQSLTVAGPLSVTVTNPNSGTSSGPVTFTVGSAGIASVTLSANQVIGGGNVTGTVTLSAAATAATTVTLASNNPVITAPASVIVRKARTSATFKVSTSQVGASQTGAVTAMIGTEAASAQLTVVPNQIATLSLSSSLILGGASTTGTVTLASPAGADTTITLSCSNAAATVPATAVVKAGATSGSFQVRTTAVVSPTFGVISASLSGSVAVAQLTVRPIGVSTVSLSPSTVTGGNSTTGTITLEAAAPAGGITVFLSSDGSAASVPASVSIAAGGNSAPFQVSTSTVTANTRVHITAAANGTAKTATLTVTP